MSLLDITDASFGNAALIDFLLAARSFFEASQTVLSETHALSATHVHVLSLLDGQRLEFDR